MQVALDYYRMLMVPIQADEPEIERAYRERSALPEEEALPSSLWLRFSTQAVEARSKLLEEAILVLLNPEHRRDYNNQLTAANPNLDIDQELLPGALMILCETGDYQAAQTLAETLLSQGHAATEDAVLTIALARLEMGREAWKEGSYEAAAQWLQNALAELQEHQHLPELQAEIQADLGKLRPYRILQLVEQEAKTAHSEKAGVQRQQGLALLQGMLQDRQGIEGTGQDGSGLGTEDFLRFVQRLRRHLTLEEQESLLAPEIERPSFVALYLAAQVQLAAGYAHHQPDRVRRAQALLARLARDQDVGLEQAVCALLLGQTQEAQRFIKETQDTDAVAFMEQHSQGSPDLLPGLCRYSEKWFTEEIFPEIKGLDPTQASLQGYFDDPQVQAYLEQVSAPAAAPAAEPHRSGSPNGNGIKMPKMGDVRPMGVPAAASSSMAAVSRAPVGLAEGSPKEPLLPPQAPQRGSRRGPAQGTPRVSDLPSLADDALKDGSKSKDKDAPRDPRAYPASMRPHLTARRQRSAPPRIPPLLKVLGLLSVVVISLLLIWQLLRALFTVSPPPLPPEQPQVEIEQPPVALDPAPPPPPPADPVPPPPPAIPAPWGNAQQVRVVSNTGLNVRATPSLQGNVVRTAAPEAVLEVLEAQLGTGGVPVWLRVDGGWVAVEFNGTRLVEPQ